MDVVSACFNMSGNAGKKWCCRQGKSAAKMNGLATCEDKIPQEVKKK